MNNKHFTAVALLLTGSLAGVRLNGYRASGGLAMPLDRIPMEIAGWTGQDGNRLPDRVIRSLSATDYLSREYRRDGKAIDLFVAFYSNQRAGESMHSPKYCLPGGGWEIVDSGYAPLMIRGREFRINNNLLYKDGSRMRLLYWYQGPRRIIASEYAGKLYLMWDSFRYGATSGSIVRLTLADAPDATKAGLSFAGVILPQIEACFRQ